MGDKSKIQWTDATWNPTRGCTRVSPGCEHCYAERRAHMMNRPGGAYEGLTSERVRWNGKIRLVEENLDQPIRWQKPRRVFVDSMSDLFHESIPFEYTARVFDVMRRAPQHTFQILTKRPQRMYEFIYPDRKRDYLWPLPNVWLGVSVENQETADERIPILLKTRTEVRFLSVEPLISPVKLGDMVHRIDWVIVGGESGPGARGCNLAWIRSVINECKRANVPCFVKQCGSEPYETKPTLMSEFPSVMRHRKGGDPDEWPSDLRVREFPLT